MPDLATTTDNGSMDREPLWDAAACNAPVSWWDGAYEGNCELPDGHDGPHFDGMSWFNDDNEEVEPPNGD